MRRSLSQMVVVVAWLCQAGDGRPHKPSESDWDSDVPFETARPGRNARMLGREGTVYFSDDCAQLVADRGGERKVWALVLPAVPDLAWNQATRQLRINGVLYSSGDRVSIVPVRQGGKSYYQDLGDKYPVVVAHKIGHASR